MDLLYNMCNRSDLMDFPASLTSTTVHDLLTTMESDSLLPKSIILEDHTRHIAHWDQYLRRYKVKCDICTMNIGLTKNAYPEPLESHRNSKRCAKYLRKMENEQRWRELSGIQALLPHTTTESTAVLSSISMNTTSSILPLARTSSRIVSPHLHSARSQAFNDEPEQIELHMFEESEQQMSEEVEQQTFEAVGQQTSEEIEL